jgi:hypothetical protein
LCAADLRRVRAAHHRTQFEAFLSLCKVTANGLDVTPEVERRCTIKCIHNAPSTFKEALFAMWATTTADQAHEILSKPDVKVTNQKDKEQQLRKLKMVRRRL